MLLSTFLNGLCAPACKPGCENILHRLASVLSESRIMLYIYTITMLHTQSCRSERET